MTYKFYINQILIVPYIRNFRGAVNNLPTVNVTVGGLLRPLNVVLPHNKG